MAFLPVATMILKVSFSNNYTIFVECNLLELFSYCVLYDLTTKKHIILVDFYFCTL